MKTIALALAISATLASSAWTEDYAAEASQDQRALQDSRAAHVAAIKAHDQAAIARTTQQVRAAYQKIWDDQALAKASTAAPAQGETRAAQLALIEAKDSYQDAVASGDRVAVAKAHAELRAAYRADWAVRHAKHRVK
jgi:hypothetical protein